MRILPWLVVLPGAAVFGSLGSLLGGIVGLPIGQTGSDFGSATLGSLTFTGAAWVLVPNKRGRAVVIGVAALFLILGLLLSDVFDQLGAAASSASIAGQILGPALALMLLVSAASSRVREVIEMGIFAISGLMLSVLGLVIHIWTVVVAYDSGGVVAAAVSLTFPVLAQFYWAIQTSRSQWALFCTRTV